MFGFVQKRFIAAMAFFSSNVLSATALNLNSLECVSMKIKSAEQEQK